MKLTLEPPKDVKPRPSYYELKQWMRMFFQGTNEERKTLKRLVSFLNESQAYFEERF